MSLFVNYVNHSVIILYFTFTVSRISPLNAHRQCY
nr:MAG TPA: hypothetical protein [Ackermannviridae sp.]